jgi:DNA-binding NtrC family response regulator
METEWNTLVISPRVERRKCLQEVFRELPVNLFSVTSIRQAKEMLSALAFEIVISEEKLDDGTYAELLPLIQSKQKNSRFFVMLPRDAQEQFAEAIRLGVTDAIPFPFETVRLENMLNRVMGGTFNEQSPQASI